MFARSETATSQGKRGASVLLQDRPASSSSSGNTNENSPVAPARTRRVSTLLLSESRASISDAQKSLRASHEIEEIQLAEPGEIVFGESQNGSLGLTDAEKYRELNTADLIVVIDMQQKLLDRLNLENREYAAQARDSLESFASLMAENGRLQAQGRLKTTNSTLDHILASDIPSETSNKNSGPPSESVLHVRDTLAAQVDQLKAQVHFKEQEIIRVREELQFTQSNLRDKSDQLELLKAKATAVPSAKYQFELELLTDSLKRTLARCRTDENEHMNQITNFSERCASLDCENKHLKEALSHHSEQREVLRIDYERERMSAETRLRVEEANKMSPFVIQNTNLEDRVKGLLEELQNLLKKETSEKIAREATEMNLHNAQQDSETRQEISDSIIRLLKGELAETKLELSVVHARHKTELEHARTDLHNYESRWKMGEQRVLRLRERLHEAETGWQENAQLLVKLYGQMDSAADRVNQPQTGHVDHEAEIDALNKELVSLRQTHENNLTTTKQLTAFVNSQSVLIDRFKEECLRLMQHVESEHERNKRQVNQARSFGQALAERYAEAVNLNRNLLTELQNVALPIIHTLHELPSA